VQIVGPALHHNVHCSAAGMPVRGVRLERLHFHFGYRVNGRVVSDPAVASGIGRAIDQKLVGAARRSTHRKIRWTGVVERPGELRVAVGRDAVRKLREHERRAAIHRHALDLPRVDHLACGRRGPLKHGSIGRHRDRLVDLSEFQRDIELLALIGSDPDVGIDVFLESRGFGGDGVRSRGKERNRIGSVSAADGLGFGARIFRRGNDFYVRNHGLLLVDNAAAECAAEFLGKGRA